jgi:hypothetical protein
MPNVVQVTAQAFILVLLLVGLPLNLIQAKRVVRGEDVRFGSRVYSRAAEARQYWAVFVASALSIIASLWLCWRTVSGWTGRF